MGGRGREGNRAMWRRLRSVMVAATLLTPLAAAGQTQAGDPVKPGVLTDMSGMYRASPLSESKCPLVKHS